MTPTGGFSKTMNREVNRVQAIARKNVRGKNKSKIRIDWGLYPQKKNWGKK
jgi:hypothetical protein